MSDSRKYYVYCEDKCMFEGMTKEQIYAAIEQAISTGKISDVDTGFVTKIKEQNKGVALSFWVGTQAEYNAITEKVNNCFYIVTDDTTSDDINKTIEGFKTEIETARKAAEAAQKAAEAAQKGAVETAQKEAKEKAQAQLLWTGDFDPTNNMKIEEITDLTGIDFIELNEENALSKYQAFIVEVGGACIKRTMSGDNEIVIDDISCSLDTIKIICTRANKGALVKRDFLDKFDGDVLCGQATRMYWCGDDFVYATQLHYFASFGIDENNKKIYPLGVMAHRSVIQAPEGFQEHLYKNLHIYNIWGIAPYEGV